MAGNLVQDESGQIFYQRAGGVLLPITEEQAQAIDENPDAADTFIRSANLALTNMGTAAASILSDDPKWDELNKLGHQEAQALGMQQPMAGLLGQAAPNVAAGVATAGLGVLPTAGVEATLGALSSPEGSRGAGALIGGGLGAAGAALPGAVQWGAGKAANMFGRSASMAEDALPPGVLRPGPVDDLGSVDEFAAPSGTAGVPPQAPAAPTATQFADDMNAAPMPMRPGQPATDAVADLPLAPSRNPPGAPPTPGPSMAVRQAAAIEREAGQQVDKVRVTGDLLTPSELRRYGVDVTPAQGRYLMATTDDLPAAEAAREAMKADDWKSSIPIAGKGLRDIKEGQRAAATNFVSNEFGTPRGVALTPGTVSQQMQNIGDQLDTIADQMGGVYIGPGIKTELENVVEHATGSHQSLIRKHVENALRLAEQNGGQLNGQDWQWLRTQLNDTIQRGVKKGDEKMITDTASIMDTLAQAMEDGLPQGTKQELKKLRKQYAIGATLHKAGVKDPDGIINPQTFYNRWSSGQGLKWKGKDDVGQFMGTLAFLTAKRTGDSGTAPRLLNAVKEGVLDTVPGGGLVRQLLP